MIILAGCGGDDEPDQVDRPFRPDTTGITVTNPAATTATAPVITPGGTVTTDAGPARRATIRDAFAAVDDDRYDEALRTFPSLTRAQRGDVRASIANRIARRARAALRHGDRSLTQSLLAQGRRFPTTRLVRTARAEYRAAERRLADAQRERLLNRQRLNRERRQRARAERAARRAREAQRRQEQQQRTTTTP